ncbi:MAG: TolB family protein [Thermoleophilaceae bacterium]
MIRAAALLTVLVSSATGGADGPSYHTTISGDGRLVTFMSLARNLVPGDRNGQYDVFVRDLDAGTTVVASRSSSGRGSQTANGRSSWPVLSRDGRFVAFQSFASDLVEHDANKRADVFVRDLRKGTTRVVSLAVRAGTRTGNHGSYDPSISAGGRFVAFQSFASNLVRGDRNRRPDIFVRDLRTGVTRIASSPGAGGQGADRGSDNPSISADGRFVAFESGATNLVPGDRNSASDVFVRDLRGGATQLVSRAERGHTTGAGPSYMSSISADGRFVAFASRADDLAPGDRGGAEDVFVRDLRTGVTRLVSARTSAARVAAGRARTIYPSISADGRLVAFHSDASDLVAGDSNDAGDVFVRDLATGTTRLVSRDGAGDAGANGYSGGPSIAADGSFVAFASVATDLVEGDTNRYADIFRSALR